MTAKALVAILAPLLLAAPTPAGAGVVELAGEALGTRWSVRLVDLPGAGGPAPERLLPAVEAALREVDARLSGWRADSEPSRFNASRSTDWFPVSADTARVVATALRVHRLSGGALDPTVWPLVAVWGFGPAPRRLAPPEPEAVRAARARLGADALAVRRDPPALRKARPGIALDLSSAGKGLAVDRVAEALAASGARRFLVDVGGELRARGRGPAGGPWPVAVERPAPGARRAGWTLGLADAALATSGAHRDAFAWRGRRFSHVLDPRTGEPIDHGLASVSVLAPTALAADAWATALLVLGPEAGWRVARREGLAVLFVEAAEGAHRARATAALERHRLP